MAKPLEQRIEKGVKALARTEAFIDRMIQRRGKQANYIQKLLIRRDRQRQAEAKAAEVIPDGSGAL